MRIVVGCDLEGFKRYYKKLALDKEWQGTFGFTEELDTRWERVLVENPSLVKNRSYRCLLRRARYLIRKVYINSRSLS